MPTQNKIMGKARSPSFFKSAREQSTSPVKKDNLPILILIVVFGVAGIMIVRSKASGGASGSGPLLSLSPTGLADQNQINNMTQSILVLAGRVHTASPAPAGGASTPITAKPGA